jgi:hypothetical protein
MFLTLKFHCNLIEVYGDGIMRVQPVRKWLNRIYDGDHISDPGTSVTDRNAVWVLEQSLGFWGNTCGVTGSAVMTVTRQWKWLYGRILNWVPVYNIYKNLKHECSCFLGYYTALIGEKVPGFQRIIVPSSSGSHFSKTAWSWKWRN